MSKAVSMKKKKYVTMDEALEGTVEFHDTIDIPKKYTGLAASFDLDIAVIDKTDFQRCIQHIVGQFDYFPKFCP